MPPIQSYRLDHMIREAFHEEGFKAAMKRKSDNASPVKTFLDNIPQTADVTLTLLRFEAFLSGWKAFIELERREERENSDE